MILLNIYIILCTKKYIIDKSALSDSKKDFAVVLGAGLTKDKKPSLVLRDRLDGAIILYENSLIEKIIVSGDHKGEEYSETEAMEKYLLDKGIPKDKIFRDNSGFSSFETIFNSKKIFNVESAYFLSQAFHLPRLIYIARKFKIDSLGLKCNFHEYSKKKHRKWKAREFPSRIKDFFLATYYILTKKI